MRKPAILGGAGQGSAVAIAEGHGGQGAFVQEQGARRHGRGLTDPLRRQPPPIGTRITYRYQQLTKNGVPRFPRYLRVRNDF